MLKYLIRQQKYKKVKTLMKQISCEYRCEFDKARCNSNLEWKNYQCQCK